MRKSSLGIFQALILFFSQAMTLQVLFYPLVLLNLITYLPRVLKNKKVIFGFLLIFFAAISVAMRGSSIPYAIILLRFYCGIVLVYGAFACNKNLQITQVSFWVFISLIGYEFVSLVLGLTPFYYANFVNAGIESEIEGRVALANNSVRPVGPTMNSSISGSILAIIFFYIIIGRKKFLLFDQHTLWLLTGTFVAFILCGSGTAMVVSIFLLFMYAISGREIPSRKLNFRFSKKLTTISFILAILVIAFFCCF